MSANTEPDERNDWGLPAVTAEVPQNRGNFSQQVDNSINKAMPWVVLVAIVSCSLAGAGLGLSVGARDTANRAERESRLQRLEVDELKVALQVQGIKIHEGVKP